MDPYLLVEGSMLNKWLFGWKWSLNIAVALDRQRELTIESREGSVTASHFFCRSCQPLQSLPVSHSASLSHRDGVHQHALDCGEVKGGENVCLQFGASQDYQDAEALLGFLDEGSCDVNSEKLTDGNPFHRFPFIYTKCFFNCSYSYCQKGKTEVPSSGLKYTWPKTNELVAWLTPRKCNNKRHS